MGTTSGATVRSRSGLLAREAWEGRLFVLPWAIGFLVFTAGPMAYSLYLAFTDYDILSPPKWVGLDNFVVALTRDPLFVVALYNTAYYVVLSVPLYMAAALLVALALLPRLPALRSCQRHERVRGGGQQGDRP